jgi:hypothetical protein
MEWACDRTLEGRDDCVMALAALGGKLMSGACDYTIRMSDLSTRGLDATLTGHEGAVFALAVEG